jgi:hypothetical protein
MKAVQTWHSLYDYSKRILDDTWTNVRESVLPRYIQSNIFVSPQKIPASDVIHQFPTTFLIYELSTVKDILLSGLQLELYSVHEKVFVYWYLSKVIEKHLHCLDSVLSIIPHGEISLFFSPM